MKTYYMEDVQSYSKYSSLMYFSNILTANLSNAMQCLSLSLSLTLSLSLS